MSIGAILHTNNGKMIRLLKPFVYLKKRKHVVIYTVYIHIYIHANDLFENVKITTSMVNLHIQVIWVTFSPGDMGQPDFKNL